MLSRQLIASLPPTHSSHIRASWLVLQCCVLTVSDFHQSRMPDWYRCYNGHVYTWVAAVYVVLVLSPTMADRELRRQQMPFICGWAVAGGVFYDVIITTRRRRFVCCLLVADLSQLDWRTSRHLTRRLCVITVRVLLIVSVSSLLEIAVRIIENEKIIPFQLKNHVWIIQEVELLERIQYLD